MKTLKIFLQDDTTILVNPLNVETVKDMDTNELPMNKDAKSVLTLSSGRCIYSTQTLGEIAEQLIRM